MKMKRTIYIFNNKENKPSFVLKALAAICKAMKKLPDLPPQTLANIDTHAAFMTAQAETLEKAEQK